ncbi:MAG: metallophosphoesterase [Gammaproteobacteria bacterium]|nr:metallophosphoesterase [Gammaproteobacteria bacterium]
MSASFIQISDCHIDDKKLVMGVDSKSNLKQVLSHVKSQAFDALLISGDLTHNGTLSSYQLLQDSLSCIDNNIHVMPGNHDNKANLSAAFNTELQNTFQLDDWQIITLDSVQINKVSGFLDKAQLSFLDDAISSSNSKYIIVCLHHPLVSMNSDWDDKLSLGNPDDLFTIVERYSKIKAILWGHAHQSECFNHKGISLFSCPSTALQFNGPESIGYNHYTLHSNGNIECKTHWL